VFEIFIFITSWLLLSGIDQLSAEAGEPWALRWVRKCAEHPLRGASAVSLIAWALSPRRGTPERNPMREAAADAESSEQARAETLGGADRLGPGSALPRLLD